jgi:two-component system, cell cycle sensor histidine kinase and response regulator CckA
MFRFRHFPHEPLARFRLLSLWLAEGLALLNVAAFAFESALEPRVRWEAGVAGLLLAAWWAYGYRRRGFPVAGWLVDAVLVSFVAAWSPLPLRAIGVFYAGVQFRAMYVPRRELILLALTYGIARVAALAIGGGDATVMEMASTWVVQVIGLAVIGITLHLFAEATRRHGEIESALKQSDERYRLVAGATRDAIYDWDVLADEVHWTESVQTVFGFRPGEVNTAATWWLDRVHPADREALEQSVNAALKNPQLTVNTLACRIRRADDTYAHIAATMLVQRNGGGLARRVVGSVRDVTTEWQLAEQLRQSQKMEAIGQLAGGVAHDFNNLLTVIGGHVYMLEHHLPKTHITERHLGGIVRAAERATTLTKQLLAFGRRQMLTPTVLDLNAVVDDVVQMVRPLIGEHIQILTNFETPLPPVSADAGQLSQVLVNLALNARDAMPDGGLLMIETEVATIESPAIETSGEHLRPGEYVRLTVRDTGEGMDEATLARAFEPFFTTKRATGGSGLGLATVYGIIKQSFGDIRAESTPGAGATFTILLPVTRDTTDRVVTKTPREERFTPVSDGARNVLLVEDDPEVRAFAEDVLDRAGYRVLPARNGLDALALIEARNWSIDVVVTDVVMPEMGGRDMVEQLRRSRPELPVLYMSGYTDDPRMLGEVDGAEARLLAKPFTAAGLVAAVNDVR